MRMKHSALLLTAGFLLMPTLLWSQLPGQGGNWGPPGGGAFPRGSGTGEPGSSGSGSGRSRMFGDPEQLFARYSKDGNTLRKEDLPPQVQMGIDMFGAQLGLTGNQWTRDDLRQATERVRTMMGASGMSFGRGGMPGMGGSGGPGLGGPSDGSRGDRGDRGDRDRRLDEAFKRLDQNQDGLLQFHEMSETLQSERDKYDSDHNGTVDLNEFREYVSNRFSAPRSGDNNRQTPRGGPDGPAAADDQERQRPTLLRAGNLPRDFPYASIDLNVDGQVGLYEWKQAGRRINEFLPMDLNNDGYMTVDEYYRWKRQGDEQAMKNGSASGDFARGRGMPNMMAFNPGMMPGGGGMPGRFGMSGMTPGMPGQGNWGSGMPSRFGMQGMTPGGGMTSRFGMQGMTPGGMSGMNWGSGMSPRGMDMSGGSGRERGYGMSGMSPGNWAGGGTGMPMVPGMSGAGGSTSFRMGERGSYTPGSMAGGVTPGMGMQGSPMQFRVPPGIGGERMIPGMGGERGPRGSDERGPGQFRERGERSERGPGDRGPGGRRDRPGDDYGGDRPPRKGRD